MMIKAVISTLILYFGLTSITIVHSATANEWQCNNYARDSVEQNKKNEAAACGFTGLRWNNDKKGQKQWCLTVSSATTKKETAARKRKLETCFKKKSSRSSRQNQLKLPTTCRASSTGYTPVRQLYSWFRYERGLYMPIKNRGLIRYDFNGDGRRDYLFIEQNAKKNVRLVNCFSQKENGYKRQLTDVSFHADLDSLSSEQYAISMKNGLLQVDINTFAHNEGSCFAKGAYSYNKSKQHFEIVSSQSDCSPVSDPETGEAYPIYPPKLPKMKK